MSQIEPQDAPDPQALTRPEPAGTPQETPEADAIRLDARGLRCPLPVIRLAAAARNAPAGMTIIVLATDPAARHDIPAWCRMRRHELREMTEQSARNENSGTPEQSGRTGECETTASVAATTDGEHPAYLRFVVLIQPQPSKASGADSSNARSSRAM